MQRVATLESWPVVGLVVLSHGVLDAFTTYGEGVSFLAPFSMMRGKSTWQPPSGLLPEMLLLWFPALPVYRVSVRSLLSIGPTVSLFEGDPASPRFRVRK